MSEPVRLLPCPFCGSAARPTVLPFEGEHYVPGVQVVCDASGIDGDPDKGCGSCSGWAETHEEAATAWNRRSPLQSNGGER